MRQRKFMIAFFMVFVMALTVIAPSFAIAKPTEHRPPSMTQQQKQIHKNSVKHKKHEYRKANRHNRAIYYHERDCYYAQPYYSNYMNGRSSYRYDYNVYMHPDYSAMADEALARAYASYLARTQVEQAEEVTIEPERK